MPAKIVLKINKQAQITLKVEGVKGGECTTLTEPLKNKLALTGKACELTPEYYEAKVEEKQQVQE